jgi:hypothetical protein
MSFEAAKLLVNLTTVVAGICGIAMLCVWVLRHDRSNFLFFAFAEKDFSYRGAVVFSFLAPRV